MSLMAKPLPSARPQTCPEPSCAAPLELPYLCGTCGELLRPPPGLNHFERFGIAPSMDLDLEALEARYLELSRKLHPDRVLGKSAATQARALALSSALNEAYQTLRDPRRRAEHLLAVHGGKSAEQDRRAPDGLLLEMMERHEEVDAARAAGDGERLAAIEREASAEEDAALDRARSLFADPAFPTPDLLDAVRLELNAANYWNTLQALARGEHG
ncbi:MAG: Fe-S protein assembly co-chaperone HscB [Planctomycetota bacterium]|nr:MAG: Fe-S protein assembly co-chaperone HscB [Planctomycetota bacterium]